MQIDKCHADWGSCHGPIIRYPQGTKYPEISNSDKSYSGRAELTLFFLAALQSKPSIRPLSCLSLSIWFWSPRPVPLYWRETVALVIVVFSPKLLLLELTWQIPSTWISLPTDPSPETQDLTGTTTTCLLFSPQTNHAFCCMDTHNLLYPKGHRIRWRT